MKAVVLTAYGDVDKLVKTFPLAQAGQAQKLAAKGSVGKVLLVP